MTEELESDSQIEQESVGERRIRFGLALGALRSERGHTVDDLVHLTKISPPFIDALEKGHFDLLPGQMFGRGFSKNICRVLGVDSTSLLALYDSCWEASEKLVLPGRKQRRLRLLGVRKKPRYGFLLHTINALNLRSLAKITAAVVAIVAGGIWYYVDVLDPKTKDDSEVARSWDQSEDDLAGDGGAHETLVGSTRSDSPTRAVTSPQEEATKADSQLPAKEYRDPSDKFISLKVSEVVTIKMVVDGESQSEKTLEPGEYSFDFVERIDVYVSNTNALKILFGGREVDGLSSFGATRRLTFVSGPLKKDLSL